MKRTNKLYLGALIILVAIASCTENKETGSASVATSLTNVVYLDIDSLYNNYSLYLDNKSVLEGEYSKAEKSIAAKLEGYQKKVADFQNRVYNTQQKSNELSPIQMQSLERKFAAEQQKLAAEEQELVQRRDASATELQGKMVALQLNLKNKVDTYLENEAEENKYDFILIKGSNGGVLYGNASLDITAQTLKDLNEAYDAEGDKLMEKMSKSE